MHNPKALLSSARQDWETPPALFAVLQREFPFVRDVGANQRNHLLPDYIDRAQDALEVSWGTSGETVYCNPPYGRELPEWVDRAIAQTAEGLTVVMLVPARPDTRWFARLGTHARDIRILPGRLRFRLNGQELYPAPFPSAVVVLPPDRSTAWPVRLWHWTAVLP